MVDVEVSRHALLAALGPVAALAKRARGTVPVLQTARVRLNGAVELAATDLDAAHFAAVPVDQPAKGEAEILVRDPWLFRNALAQMVEPFARISVGADGAAVICGDVRLALDDGKMAVDDWPVPADLAATAWMPVGGDFADALEFVLDAVSSEETRYYLNGVAVRHLGDWQWRLAATDGHRLHIAQFAVPGFTGEPWKDDVIIPKAVLNQLLAAARSPDGAVLRWGTPVPANAPASAETATLAVDPPPRPKFPIRAEIVWGTQRLVTKLIDGTFPDVMRVVPQQIEATIAVDRTALLRGLRLILAARGTGKGKTCPVTIEREGESLRLTAFAPDGLVPQVMVPIVAANWIGATPVKLGFNARYLLAVASALRGDVVRFGWQSVEHAHSSPSRIEVPGETGRFIVQMPMRV